MPKRRKRRSTAKKPRRNRSQSAGRIKTRLLAICFISFALLILFFVVKDMGKEKTPRTPPAKKSQQTQRSAGAAPKAFAAKNPVVIPVKPELPAPPPARPVVNIFDRVQLTQEELNKPKIVFVIDDIGYHLDYERELKALGDDVTYAILPMLPYSVHYGNLAEETGAEVILHQPMETVDGTIPGRGLITRSMPAGQIESVLRANLKTVPNHIGINNHMGSLGTTDLHVMGTVLNALKQEGLLFLDSRTNSRSVGTQVASELGMIPLARDVFLDNQESKEYITGQVRQLEPIALQKGYAIGIGHIKKNTLEVLAAEIPRLRKAGFVIVNLRKIAVMKKEGLL